MNNIAAVENDWGKSLGKIRKAMSELVNELENTSRRDETQCKEECTKKLSNLLEKARFVYDELSTCFVDDGNPSAYSFLEPPNSVDAPDSKVCPICLKKFSRASAMVEHVPVHDSSPRFACDICGKLFFRKTARSHHLRKHH